MGKKDINIEDMNEDQLATLEAQIEAKRKAKAARIQEERDTYKALVDASVEKTVKRLQMLSDEMQRIKTDVFEEFASIIDMKNELFNTKIDRQSDTFTTSDGCMSLTIGNRVNEGWDDTVEAGISKVKDYLATLAKDDNSAALVETVMSLLAKDRKGALKANKVLELERLAIKSQNTDFMDGINIIKAAYRPVPTCQFIQVEMKDKDGNKQNLPLSMAAM